MPTLPPLWSHTNKNTHKNTMQLVTWEVQVLLKYKLVLIFICCPLSNKWYLLHKHCNLHCLIVAATLEVTLATFQIPFELLLWSKYQSWPLSKGKGLQWLTSILLSQTADIQVEISDSYSLHCSSKLNQQVTLLVHLKQKQKTEINTMSFFHLSSCT